MLKGGGEAVDEFAEADALVGCESVELGSGFRGYFNIEGLGVAIETLAAGFPEFSQDDSVGILIGMNVICKGDFAISNYEGRTAMSFRFPSMGMIDFEKEIQG